MYAAVPSDHAVARPPTVTVGECDNVSAAPPVQLCEAEVEHLYRAVGRDLDVGRLEVAMDDPLFVRASSASAI